MNGVNETPSINNNNNSTITAINKRMNPLYCVLCPRGIEDVVMFDLEKIAPPIRIHWKSKISPKQLLPGLSPCSSEMNTSQYPEETEKSHDEHHGIPEYSDQGILRGGFFFTLSSSNNENIPASIEDTEIFLDKASRVRSVELLLLHLMSAPCTESPEELNEPLIHVKEDISTAVIEHLSALRTAAAGRSHLLSGYQGPWFHSPLTNSTVMFRVNCVRRESGVTSPFSSQQLAAYIGESIFEQFDTTGWRVNMLYYNVEFFALHDVGHVHLGLVLTPPALPRVGAAMHYTAQLGMELLRQRIGNLLLHNNNNNHHHHQNNNNSNKDMIDLSVAVRAAIPRPGAVRHELRVLKGENAMRPAVAAALCRYAAVGAGAVLVDPFVGSGTLLLEGWAAAGFAPVSAWGGDCGPANAAKTHRNVQPDVMFLAAVNGLLADKRQDCLRGEVAVQCRALLQALETYVEAMPHPCAAHASGEYPPQIKCVEAEKAAEKLQQLLASHYNLNAQAFHWDATRLPLRNNSVDCIISDLPFGRRCGSHKVNTKLYPMMIRESYRILRTSRIRNNKKEENGDQHHFKSLNFDQKKYWWVSDTMEHCGRAVLLTIEGKLMMDVLENLRHECPFKLLHPPFAVDMGGLYPYVFVLEKE
ncbi:putative THUMP domain-containing protein 3-like [Trypanosoma theileri]|uniref:Putative THUMP domain-containing protein 3-like n=1 Tax=Trypanosoma theileri TaxID=67003 RepID=A0A1X0P9R5_9TRYP|nr:putative THUMP domain-containing protein 3-like [Trypanosoma theileri]ORC93571.1 putative THUMP domain-containing protein 3-like [Trypanosoma theileri]